MSKTALEIVAPLLAMIEDFATAPVSELAAFQNKMYELSLQIRDELENFDREIQAIRESNDDLEEKLRKMKIALDKLRSTAQEGDLLDYRMECADQYGDCWGRMDPNSREFIVTAHYVFDKMKSKGGDFAPAIIEYCRSFENELQKKIYIDYVNVLAEKEPPVYDVDADYENLTKAVEKKKRNREYFLSSTDMVKYLGKMRGATVSRTGYCNDMKRYLGDLGWDPVELSDYDFENKACDYIDNYRNKAAHPNLLDERKAVRCERLTAQMVERFLSCKVRV